VITAPAGAVAEGEAAPVAGALVAGEDDAVGEVGRYGVQPASMVRPTAAAAQRKRVRTTTI